MISIVIIVLGVVLNILPANVQSFIITTPEKKSIRYERQSDGGWEETPRTDGARFFVKGLQMSIKSGGEEMPMDLSWFLGITKDTDWTTVNDIRFKNEHITILRHAEGLDITISPSKQQSAEDIIRLYQVRWEKKGK